MKAFSIFILAAMLGMAAPCFAAPAQPNPDPTKICSDKVLFETDFGIDPTNGGVVEVISNRAAAEQLMQTCLSWPDGKPSRDHSPAYRRIVAVLEIGGNRDRLIPIPASGATQFAVCNMGPTRSEVDTTINHAGDGSGTPRHVGRDPGSCLDWDEHTPKGGIYISPGRHAHDNHSDDSLDSDSEWYGFVLLK